MGKQLFEPCLNITTYKSLQSQAEQCLDSIVKECYRILNLIPITKPFTPVFVDANLAAKVHNFIVNDSKLEIQIGIKRSEIFFHFAANIPRNLFYADEEKIKKFWQNHNRIKYFERKFVK